MYFPYLRGRQYELIAIRELVEKDRLSEKVVPIIEPVKISSTLLTTINTFNSKKRNLIVISNPTVGTYIADSKKEKNKELYDKVKVALKNENIYWGIIVNDNSDSYYRMLVSEGIETDHIVAICFESDKLSVYDTMFENENPKYTICPYAPSFRRFRKGSRIMIDDKFIKLPRNSDYIEHEDEFFTDDYQYYKEEGYSGFSDYSIVGKDYSESGFAPFAVAIHIVYFSNDMLRIHHFVSDSNDDISDPANKFYEALSKLIEWNKGRKLNTFAMEIFEDMFEKESYPGLGVVKKLSIMHHIELMGRKLDDEVAK